MNHSPHPSILVCPRCGRRCPSSPDARCDICGYAFAPPESDHELEPLDVRRITHQEDLERVLFAAIRISEDMAPADLFDRVGKPPLPHDPATNLIPEPEPEPKLEPEVGEHAVAPPPPPLPVEPGEIPDGPPPLATNAPPQDAPETPDPVLDERVSSETETAEYIRPETESGEPGTPPSSPPALSSQDDEPPPMDDAPPTTAPEKQREPADAVAENSAPPPHQDQSAGEEDPTTPEPPPVSAPPPIFGRPPTDAGQPGPPPPPTEGGKSGCLGVLVILAVMGAMFALWPVGAAAAPKDAVPVSDRDARQCPAVRVFPGGAWERAYAAHPTPETSGEAGP